MRRMCQGAVSAQMRAIGAHWSFEQFMVWAIIESFYQYEHRNCGPWRTCRNFPEVTRREWSVKAGWAK